MQISSSIIKQTSQNCGFALCGIAKADPLTLAKARFEKALAQNLHAQKEYLERDIDKRFHPKLLLENCKSVIVCGFNYNMEDNVDFYRKGRKDFSQRAQSFDLKHLFFASFAKNLCVLCGKKTFNFKFTKHAQIRDYHHFMKEKLEKLAEDLQAQFGDFNYKATVDSSNISEKAWAVQSGIGYYGKNGIIQTQLGSFVFLGILLIDREVDLYDTPNSKTCGNCRKCMDACPTQAIVEPYCIDCNQCIVHIASNRKATDFSRIAQYGWLNGCDVCQNVCPNNIHAPINEEALAMRTPFVENQKEILETLTPESFEQYFKDTVLYDFKYEGLKKRLEDFTK
jgi:epoxyqueuosine reductase